MKKNCLGFLKESNGDVSVKRVFLTAAFSLKILVVISGVFFEPAIPFDKLNSACDWFLGFATSINGLGYVIKEKK